MPRGVYEVQLVDAGAPQHIADYDLYLTICRSQPHLSFISKLQQHAQDYWQGVCVGTRELLTTSDLKVVRRVR